MSNRSPLVSQFLENISRQALEKYQSVIRKHFRDRHGIYALYRKGKLHYVGLASNLRGRLKGHLKNHNANRWDHFSIYLTVGDEHLRELESLLLRIVKPSGNKQVGKFHRRCQDLKRTLARDLRDQQKQELNSLLGRTSNRRRTNENNSRPMHRLKTAKGELHRYISKPMKLRKRYKRKLYRAVVRRDGTIRFNGEIYGSPSKAGEALRGRPTNGWQFWEYERAPGDWVRLHNLRPNSVHRRTKQ